MNQNAKLDGPVDFTNHKTVAHGAVPAVHLAHIRQEPPLSSRDAPAQPVNAPDGHPPQESPAARFLHAVPSVATRQRATSVGGAGRSRLSLQFALMVILPFALLFSYLYGVATPLYEARSVIAITNSSDAEASAPAGLLASIETSAALQEAFRADMYINSQALMDALEDELGLVTDFSGPAIDPVRRLRPLPWFSVSMHDQFDRFVESSIDVRSGLMTLYVRAPSAEHAIAISDAVLMNAENHVAHLGQTLFDKRQSYAAEMRAEAEAKVQQAQARLLELQFQHQEVDPRNRIENIYGRIRELENEVQRLDNDISTAEIAGIADSPQTVKLVALQAHIRAEIDRERAQLVSPEGSSATPLNNLLMDYEMAQLEVDLARQSVQTAIEAQAEAGREAALNRSVFQVVVPPTTAGTAVYPKAPGILALWLVVLLAAFAAVMSFFKARQ